MLHGVQGAYLWKQFGKHGELHNPHAYGYFDHVPHQNFFGGHVTVGGIVYRGDAYPEKFHGKYIAGDLLGHGVYWHDIEPRGTTFQTKHGGELLVANDTWFATSDVCLSPNGCVYVADWHDKRTAHPDPDADWDRRNGRVYRIEYGERKEPVLPNLGKASSDELLKLLFSNNHWLATRARRLLGEKRDANIYAPLEKIIAESKDEHDPLKALWALEVSGGFDEKLGCELLDHKSPLIRRWVVRLLGDPKKVEPTTAARLRKLAEEDASPLVRSQLACTAKRLPTQDAIPIIKALLSRNETGDEKDPYIPLLLWWAVEEHCVAAELDLPDFLTAGEAAKNPIARDTILPRLVRRYVSAGINELDEATAVVLAKANLGSEASLLEAVERGMQMRPTGKEKLTKVLLEKLKDFSIRRSPSLFRILVRTGDRDALARAREVIFDSDGDAFQRASLLELVTSGLPSEYSGVDGRKLMELLQGKEPEAVKLAALSAVGRVTALSAAGLEKERLAPFILKTYPGLTEREKAAARSVLLGRKDWATDALAAVNRGSFPAKEFSIEELRIVAAYGNPGLSRVVSKHWGKIDPPTKEEVLADVRRLNNDLRAFPGNVNTGKVLFTKHCATCHKLFNEGGAVGPDLTFANRTDRDFLLISTVDPSAVVRKEFQSFTALLNNGTVATGLIGESTPERVTFIDAKAQKMEVPRSQIEKLQESPTSLMPDNILKQLKPDELRDLFAYLQKP
jgi:putative heme-binding domain-containing protein